MDLTALVGAAGPWSYILVFAVTASEAGALVGLLLPGETAILFAAALAGRGLLDPVPLAVAVVAGGITGDSAGYALGHWFARQAAGGGPRRRIRSGGPVDRAAGYLRRRGGPAVFTGRFIGFVRSFVPFAAGAAGMPYRGFLAYSATASLVWGVGNVALGYFLGASAERLLHTVGVAGAIVAGGAVLAALLAIRIRRRSATPVSRAERRIVHSDDDDQPPPAAPVPPSRPPRAMTKNRRARCSRIGSLPP